MYSREKRADGRLVQKITKRGYDVIRDPLINKGTGFSLEERRALGLEGLLPNEIHDISTQRDRVYRRLQRLPDDLKKYESINSLQDRNEQLFYSLLCEHMEEFLPIIYTPTVGQATKKYSHVFRRGRGVWITPEHRGRIGQIFANAGRAVDIKLIVVTDNESILGIGDQGAGGMAISVGKLSLYCAAAGIHPSQTLPVSLDVGTENAALLDDPLYLGWRHRRLRGVEYDELVAEFVDEVKKAFPDVLVQWEDFRKDNALTILDRYQKVLPSFNDDIQGTGAVALAGIVSALRLTKHELTEQRVVIHGAGAAGLGIARQIKNGMQRAGLSTAQADAAVAVLDSRGLLIDDGGIRDHYKQELAWSQEQAETYGLCTESSRELIDVVSAFAPTVLIGTSGQAGAFTQEVVVEMARQVEQPIILPFSNPNDLSEARPQDLYNWTKGRCLVATGSPFPDVDYAGTRYKIGQGNNAFIFPGLGLGSLIARASQVTEEMISAAATALATLVTEEELAQGLLFPSISRLREAAECVAIEVIKQAVEQGVGTSRGPNIEQSVKDLMWEPVYPDYEVG